MIHYRRFRKDYAGWGLHLWGHSLEKKNWESPLLPAGEDDFGVYWVVHLPNDLQTLNYVIHREYEKDSPNDQVIDVLELGWEVWLIEGAGESHPPQFTNPDDAIKALLAKDAGDIKNKAQAHWLTSDTIAWHIGFIPRAIYKLHYSPYGLLKLTANGIDGSMEMALTFLDDHLSAELAEKFPHLKTAAMLKLLPKYRERVPDILKGQCAVSVKSPSENFLAVAALQIPGILDDLYAYHGPLGVSFDNGKPLLRVWAPTARSVNLHLFLTSTAAENAQVFPMTWDPETGVWSIKGYPDWIGRYYLYEVDVFSRPDGRFVRNLVTDPYSVSLSTNSTRSQIVDLNQPQLFPESWNELSKNNIKGKNNDQIAFPTDQVLYELHVRDFSANDLSVPEDKRGTYQAFAQPESLGMKHLKRLAEAGVTHIHLLPVADNATINENRYEWQKANFNNLMEIPPDSDLQQAVLSSYRGRDGYNWGYDPYHYFVPEGGYACDPDGTGRIREFRQMVAGLRNIGLRVVMDVVYNHTFAAGQDHKSVLDRIVPGYYYRLNHDGDIETSTCCSNTASEHSMMEKLMIDSLLSWVVNYKIDGFRFDLMGHHMKRNMDNVRGALDGLTFEKDGVDGKSILIYGEGWDFGEVANNARGQNATQWNLRGTGIGTFNDRLRSALRGGSPFGEKWEQGFVTGLYTDPNEFEQSPPGVQREKLLEYMDQVCIGLAGNLADYKLTNSRGIQVCGSQIANGYGGYTSQPQENIVYVSAHDNETLFDAIQYKAPLSTSMDDRLRIQMLALSIVALSQGVPFFHAGCEILRSKSFDRNSYNAGDWFNKLDWTYHHNNWGVGLPFEDKNSAHWATMKERLARSDLAPSRKHIMASLNHFEEVLRIRRSSPLFRLRSAEEVIKKVRFHNTWPGQYPGLIVMSISDLGSERIDIHYNFIVVFFNALKTGIEYSIPDLHSGEICLHPIQVDSQDTLVKTSSFNPFLNTFYVPGRTTAVFVSPSQE